MTTKFDVGELVNIKAIVTGIMITSSGQLLYEINLRSASGFAVTQVVEESQIVKEEVKNGSSIGFNNEGCEQESKRRGNKYRIE